MSAELRLPLFPLTCCTTRESAPLFRISMSLIVMKFGGTSVGSAERIRQAASIVRQHAQRGDEVVVVVSALSKVTDLILKILNSARLGQAAETEQGLEQLRLRHKQVLEELCH